ncbi:hypothetical protein HYPSUDRAFT_194125 [Hypholoma sublateritium FD-334 SS-4]|uniref:Uncharacterized protein n=1 Tax=Hypholoma sublateritium (strain FD-334 SS-4) TaxID=945553 RepID=A0A0D2P580_HYPSF|nr:hypothetical protein HYPSUDRAFT_194125 [Hypholoma sublateritium FD-334 SS-4]
MSMLARRSVRGAITRAHHNISLTRSMYATSSKLAATKAAAEKPDLPTSAAQKPEPVAVGPLDRPLGVRQRPTTVVQTRTERVKELLDSDARTEQRRHLIKEAGKGYFHDMNMTRRNGGKTWVAPNVLIREDKALYFPNVNGQCLEDGLKKNTTTMCFGKISLIAMLGSQISQARIPSHFAQATSNHPYSRFRTNPLFQYVQVNLQENILKSFLVRMFSNSLRSTVPKELHPTYLVSSQNMEYVHDPLGMTNSKVGYVYLLDENLRIRWAGCADAYPTEPAALESCTGVLLKRLEEKAPKTGPVAASAT